MQWLLGFFGGNLISLCTIGASRRRKALHDFFVHTTVWRGRPASGGELEVWRIAALVRFPFLWLVATFVFTL